VIQPPEHSHGAGRPSYATGTLVVLVSVTVTGSSSPKKYGHDGAARVMCTPLTVVDAPTELAPALCDDVHDHRLLSTSSAPTTDRLIIESSYLP
jgi:hypothetical protein